MPFGRVHAEVWDDMNMLIFPSYTCLCGIIGAAVTFSLWEQMEANTLLRLY